MYIEWEDRKTTGWVNDHSITEKPVLSFEYAYFLIDDEEGISEYVESHEEGYWNKDMTPEQDQEVRDFYNSWVPPEPAPPTLEEAKAEKVMDINMAYESELSSILDKYPDVETKTWDKQESEARAWLADNSADTPLLDALAQGRQMDMAELVSRVIAKADAWVALSGAATGKRQRLEDEIEAATTVEDVDAIVW